MDRMLPAALPLLGALLIACPAAAEPACPTDVTITSVQRVEDGVPVATRPGGTQLGDTIRVSGPGVSALAACAGSRPLVLFLAGRGFSTLQPVNRGTDTLDFEIGVRPPAPGFEPDPWKLVLGQPLDGKAAFPVSVGVWGEPAARSDLTLLVDRVPRIWFSIWLLVFAGLLGLFFYCLGRTAILRDPISDPESPETLGTYSLARTQAAWWFFVILASYLLIGLVTGDFFTSLNGTALTLLGIGAGTAVIGSAIDATAAPADSGARAAVLPGKVQELEALEADTAGGFAAKIADLDAEIARLGQIATRTADEDALKAAKEAERAGLAARAAAAPLKKAALDSQIAKLRGRSEGFFRDIVSDANGASFPRFQMLGWTVVLTVVFVRGVYTELAMPTFDLTLLGLMGLSAATYLGMKTNEPAAPPPS